MCNYWIKDPSFPKGYGLCTLKNIVIADSGICELFRRKEEEVAAIRVLTY
jgi:hypothetical protein